MIFLIPLSLAFLTGFFLIAVVLRGSPIPNKLFFLSALSFPAGLGIFSFMLFVSYALFSRQSAAASLLFCVLSFCAFAVFYRQAFIALWKDCRLLPRTFKTHFDSKWKKTSLGPKLVFVFLLMLLAGSLAAFSQSFFTRSISDFYGGWDARYFWNLKAKFFFRAPSEWKGMFHSALCWSHPDYPLLVPGAVAWGWESLKAEAPAWPTLVGYVFSLSLVLLVIWYLSAFVSAASAVLSGAFLLCVPAFRLWSATQYADVPLAFFMTASSLSLVLAFRNQDRNLFLLSGLLAGLGAWTKNEGLSFLLLLGLCLVFLLWREKGKDARTKTAWAFRFFLGGAVFAAAVLYIKIFLDPCGNEFVSSRRSLPAVLALLLDPRRIQIVAGAYGFFIFSPALWRGLWVPFFAALLLSKAGRGRPLAFLPAFLVLAQETVYFFILVSTPTDLYNQLQTALTRLMVHCAPLALIFAVETLGRFGLSKRSAASS